MELCGCAPRPCGGLGAEVPGGHLQGTQGQMAPQELRPSAVGTARLESGGRITLWLCLPVALGHTCRGWGVPCKWPHLPDVRLAVISISQGTSALAVFLCLSGVFLFHLSTKYLSGDLCCALERRCQQDRCSPSAPRSGGSSERVEKGCSRPTQKPPQPRPPLSLLGGGNRAAICPVSGGPISGGLPRRQANCPRDDSQERPPPPQREHFLFSLSRPSEPLLLATVSAVTLGKDDIFLVSPGTMRYRVRQSIPGCSALG